LRIAVGMSGGVDSAVTAMLLKKAAGSQGQGHEVVGVFMKNWDSLEETGRDCQADKEAADAERICQHLDIPFRQVDFVKEYWNEVFTPLLEGYQNGETPFPDVDCNRNIKFGHFHRHCVEELGCDYVASGHYARVNHNSASGESQLLQAMDRVKDQTLFLSQVRQEALQRSLFPLGNLTKDVVKAIASSGGLDWVAKKRESMGICFIGKRSFKTFIDEYVAPSSGDLIDIDTGKVLGRHDGAHKYTLGQRVRIAGANDRLFVVDKDIGSQVITVASGEQHPALFSETFFTHSPHWISGKGPPRQLQSNRHRLLECDYRSQNKMPLVKCAVTFRMTSSTNWEYVSLSNGLTVSVVRPQRAVTAGQYAAFYDGEVCLGSAKIERVGPSLYTMNHNNCRTKIQEKIKSEEQNSSDS